MKRDLVRLVGGLLFGGAILVALAACAGPTGASPSPPDGAAPPPSAATTALPTNGQPVTQPANNATSDPLSKGKLIFEKTAGGMGCAICHGMDGKGNGPAGVGAPTIRGKMEGDVRAAISGGVPMMTTIITLNDEEISAVVAYMQYLSEQP